MTNSAFTLALVLGVALLVGMVWIANTASFRVSVRHRHFRAARAHAAEGDWGFMQNEDEPELDLGDVGTESRHTAQESLSKAKERA